MLDIKSLSLFKENVVEDNMDIHSINLLDITEDYLYLYLKSIHKNKIEVSNFFTQANDIINTKHDFEDTICYIHQTYERTDRCVELDNKNIFTTTKQIMDTEEAELYISIHSLVEESQNKTYYYLGVGINNNILLSVNDCNKIEDIQYYENLKLLDYDILINIIITKLLIFEDFISNLEEPHQCKNASEIKCLSCDMNMHCDKSLHKIHIEDP